MHLNTWEHCFRFENDIFSRKFNFFLVYGKNFSFKSEATKNIEMKIKNVKNLRFL